MNSKLYGNKVELPEDVLTYLGQCFDAAKGADDKTEGFKRNKELRDSREVTYQQLKRMKNFFDNFNGKESDLPYILNGGHYVKDWVGKTLDGMRRDTKSNDEFRPHDPEDPHTNIDVRNLNRPSKSHKTNLGQYDLQVTESLRRIKDIINKII